MSKTYIIKIGTFIEPTNDKSSIGLLTGEPKNFANALLQMQITDKIIFASNTNYAFGDYEYKDVSNIDAAMQFCNDATDNDVVIFWQGAYKTMEDQPCMINTYKALESAQIFNISKQFFVLTDTRLPLLDLDTYLKSMTGQVYNNVINIDYTKVIMLTQAAKCNELYSALQNDTLITGIPEYDNYYVTNFKAVKHLELYALPLISHALPDYLTTNNIWHSHDMIFTAQSFEYMQYYRLDRLCHLLLNSTATNNIVVDFDIAIYGKHEQAGVSKLLNYLYKYNEQFNTGSKFIALPKLIGPIKFNELKYVIAASKTQLCISELDYIKYDLLPNRIFESIAVNTFPLICADIINSTTFNGLVNFAKHINCIVNDSNDVANSIHNIQEQNHTEAYANIKELTLHKFKNTLMSLYER